MPRPSLRRCVLATLLASLAAAACSDSQDRDQHYGTDAAAGYRGPDGGLVSLVDPKDAVPPTEDPDAAPMDSASSSDADHTDAGHEDAFADADDQDANTTDAGDSLIDAATGLSNMINAPAGLAGHHHQ